MYRTLTVPLLAAALLPALWGCRQQPREYAYVYTVPEATTFEDVAGRVYNDPAQAYVLRDANPQIASPILTAGTRLAVPKLRGPNGERTIPCGCQRVDTWWDYPGEAPECPEYSYEY